MECSVQNDGKTLQGLGVTVTDEEWDSSTKRMGRKKGKKIGVQQSTQDRRMRRFGSRERRWNNKTRTCEIRKTKDKRNSYIDIDFVAISKISTTAVPQNLPRLTGAPSFLYQKIFLLNKDIWLFGSIWLQRTEGFQSRRLFDSSLSKINSMCPKRSKIVQKQSYEGTHETLIGHLKCKCSAQHLSATNILRRLYYYKTKYYFFVFCFTF